MLVAYWMSAAVYGLRLEKDENLHVRLIVWLRIRLKILVTHKVQMYIFARHLV
jgi:hypothetical protein